MANPTKYERSYGFADYQSSNPTLPLPGIQVDVNLDDIEASIGEIVDAIAEVRRSDGALQNGVVTVDSLSASVKELLTLTGTVLRGSWVTATAYAVGDLVQQAGANYVCAIAHTSGVFATDLTAGKWVGTVAMAASTVTVSPVGNIVATNVQAALAELDSDLSAEISARQADVTSLYSSISTNTTAIATNTSAISTITANNWVTTARIADANVTTAKIADANVTAAKLASMTSSELAGKVSDETGSGALVFATSPTLVTPVLGAATATSVGITNSAGSVGFATGSGGTVTQLTNKTTAVTLNRPAGRITMNNAALAANTVVAFQLTNSSIAGTDTVITSVLNSSVADGANYETWATSDGGAAKIMVRNVSGGSLSEAVQINFQVIKGATS